MNTTENDAEPLTHNANSRYHSGDRSVLDTVDADSLAEPPASSARASDSTGAPSLNDMEFGPFIRRVLPQLIKVALINVNNSLLSSQYGMTTHVGCPIVFHCLGCTDELAVVRSAGMKIVLHGARLWVGIIFPTEFS